MDLMTGTPGEIGNMLESLEGAQGPIRHLPEGLPPQGDGVKDRRNIRRTTLLIVERLNGQMVNAMIVQGARQTGVNVLEVETEEIVHPMKHTAKERLLESKIVALVDSLRTTGNATISKGAGIPLVQIPVDRDIETMPELVDQYFLKSKSNLFSCSASRSQDLRFADVLVS
jgi:hypothetical protein